MERCGGFGIHDLRPVWVSWLGMDICCGGLDEGPERPRSNQIPTGSNCLLTLTGTILQLVKRQTFR